MISERARELAFRANSGELAWRRSDLAEALASLVKQDLAVLGGEAWIVRNGSVSPVVGITDEREEFFGWDTAQRAPQEDWQTYVARCASESLAAVADFSLSGDSKAKLEDLLYFNLTWVTEQELAQL